MLIKKIAFLALASLLTAALPALAEETKAPVKKEAATSPSDVLLKVNGIAITRGDRDREAKIILDQNRVQQPAPPELMARAEEAALDQLTAKELLYQAAKKLNMKDLDKKIAEQMEKNRAQFKTEADLEKKLKEIGMSMQDLQEFTRRGITISNLLDTQFAEKTTVSDADAKKFYDENLERYFKKKESIKASHILIGADKKATAEERQKAKEKAEAILKRVKGGEDFAAIAKADSTCPSASQGGDLGQFGRGQMVKPFEDAAFALKTGEISNVVETDFGYHIIKVTEKQDASAEKFEDVKPKIAEFLKREKLQKAVADYVQELKKSAKIEKP